MRHDGEFTLILLRQNVLVTFYRCLSHSGADVLGGDAAPQRNDGGKVGVLLHRPGLEDLTAPSGQIGVELRRRAVDVQQRRHRNQVNDIDI